MMFYMLFFTWTLINNMIFWIIFWLDSACENSNALSSHFFNA